ncbi:MAG: isochorismatase family protein [Anaerolineales bacterium]|nr:isochorismatase family protein [Anaerolineales bacterium]
MRKERYFSPDTIQDKSRELLACVEQARRRHAEVVFQLGKAALLVLDLQEYFLQESSHAFVPSAPAILPGISRVVTAFSNADRPAIFTRHVNTPEDAGMMASWWRDLINPQSAYSHNITIPNSSKSISITKSQYDAFLDTSLEATLQKLGVGQVVICGVMTHLCCETTARSAFMHGFEVFFTVNGTATYNEELHRASLLTLSHGFAIPVLIEELLHTMETNEA